MFWVFIVLEKSESLSVSPTILEYILNEVIKPFFIRFSEILLTFWYWRLDLLDRFLEHLEDKFSVQETNIQYLIDELKKEAIGNDFSKIGKQKTCLFE